MKIAFLGAGRMGGWLATQLAGEHEVVAYDQDPEKARGLQGVRALASLEELKEFAPDLLVNAVGLASTIAAYRSVTPLLPANCVLADMASVKGDIPAYYAECGFRFASIHPMFGPTFANLEALKQENAIIIKESEPGVAALFRGLFQGLGLRLFEYTFEEHDKMMAYSLTTPFTATLVFAAMIDETVVPGTSFAKHLQIARGVLSEDDELLAETLFNPKSLTQLAAITSRLEFLKHIILGRDVEEARRFFARLRRNVR